MSPCSSSLALRAQPAGGIDYSTAHLERKLDATRASGPIAIDGSLDEPAWRDAPMATGSLQQEPREGQPATFDTDVRVLYDDQALYFGVFAHHDDPDAIIVSDLKKDFNPSASDAFLVVVDTCSDQRNGFEFATNPAGAKWDAQISNEGRERNTSWDGIWEVRTRITSNGWSAEIRIPFRTLTFTVQDPQTWGINFERRLRRRNENSFWAPLPRIYTLDHVSLAGSLDRLSRLRPGRQLRVKPFAAASSSTVGMQPSNGAFDVEADEQQANLTRFSILFPEKREFFLENSGIFQFGLPSTGTAAVGSASPAASGRQNSPPDLKLPPFRSWLDRG